MSKVKKILPLFQITNILTFLDILSSNFERKEVLTFLLLFNHYAPNTPIYNTKVINIINLAPSS